MKKKLIYAGMLVLSVAVAGFAVIKYQHTKTAAMAARYELVARKDSSNSEEWFSARQNVQKLLARLHANAADTKSALALANAYIIEARISGNFAYYDKAAMQQVENVLANEPENYEALLLKSLLQLSQHHFADGLATAKTAENINRNNAFVYGLLVDANVEMGSYDSALDAADKMVSIRPDIRSYSRIAYLREIHGDYAGAIDAMQLAVQAGMPSEETTEWCRSQLGKLYELSGQVDKARYEYQLSLAARPGYPNALAGLGRIATHEHKYDSAVIFLTSAAKASNDVNIKQQLAQSLAAAGQAEKASAIMNEVIDEMNKMAAVAKDDPSAGHYSDRELAYVYLQHNKYDKALEHALAEYNRRPKNIDVNETVAWVYYKRKEFDKAIPFMKASLLTHSMNPVLLCTSGLIYNAAGDKEKAKLMLSLGLKHNPVMPLDIQEESIETLKIL